MRRMILEQAEPAMSGCAQVMTFDEQSDPSEFDAIIIEAAEASQSC